MLSFLCAILVAPSIYAEQGQELRLDSLVAGARLLLYVTFNGDPTDFGIELVSASGGKPKPVRNLNDLSGHVAISSPGAALNFVRLLTSRSTWDLDLGKTMCEAEVVPLSVSRSAANYGIKPDSIPARNAGWLGVLPDALFKRIHVAPAQVKADGSGFIVMRTLLVDDRSRQRFEYCEEQVRPNGAYRRRVLKSSPAPKSDNWFWYFPRKQ